MTAITDDKAELRKKLRFRRNHHVEMMADWERRIAFGRPASPLLEMLPENAVVGIYMAKGSEADPHNIGAVLAAEGHSLALPRLNAEAGSMDFAAYCAGDTLVRSALGIAEPAREAPTVAPDVILCPLIGFDRQLGRLGQGGGYYDRAFARFPDAQRIGLAWSVQECDYLPQEPHDVPLHAIMTEREWILTS